MGYVIIRKNMPSLFSFPVKDVLFFGFVVILILVGTLKGQILFVSINQNNVVYGAYVIIILSQVIFRQSLQKEPQPSPFDSSRGQTTSRP